jgi:hypothetical protein
MTDWYIDQMKTKTYESEPLPISSHMTNMWETSWIMLFTFQKTDGI